jgi:hypothetical protein
MEDLQGLGFIPNSIVHMDRRMEDAAHFRETFDGLAEARKVSQKIDVVQQCEGVILPGPRDNLVQIG